jgi:endonuclease/exonuclease/phosphatase (EEP) superfamily protein YafD
MVLYALPELQHCNGVTALAASFVPYGIPAWTAATLIFGLAGRRRTKLLALLAVVCLAVQAIWARAYWPGTPLPSSDASLTVMTMNVRCDEPALTDLAAAVEREQPDIVVLQDLSQDGWDQLVRYSSWLQIVPRHSALPEDQPLTDESDPCGTVVFAKEPVSSASPPDAEQPVFSIDLPAAPLTVVPVSLPTVVEGVEPWLRGFQLLDEAVAAHEANVGAGAVAPMLVIGDFNATREHLPMRQLIAEHGLVDAAEQAGAGWQPTFPANRRYPPLIAIDHILMSPSLAASEVTAFSVRWGAHRVLMARLTLA